MGYHTCLYCDDPTKAATSSGDVLLVFQSGRAYIMPDMVSHYVEEHGWRPPSAFVDDVMNSTPVEGNHDKKKSQAIKIGYLDGLYDAGGVPPAFALRLRQFVEKAQKAGNRTQMRSG
jgi:hypothetical protein